ncbi:hypothetical protein IEQ34_015818 [Dendrobium chrysotoxum]|uniref:Uncharacterized protein n=1 Tax=Dendrobium chrysotoxum TaxID=161865 RepID=A0AAV7GH55_DENCH|nr:hypothetical protein IEQ34_015818 [Dendrobium chrysotoxum]
MTFRSKGLDMRTQDPVKSWANTFFFVKNDWGLLEKWGKMRDLPAPLHVKEEDIMWILKVPNIELLLHEVCYLNKYIEEKFLFKRASIEKVAVLEAENKRSQTLIAEKEAAFTGFESSRVVENFKKSIAFKTIIQDRIQEARDYIYEIECINEGFIRGFLKGVRLVQRKIGVEVEGLTPSQALDDFPSDYIGDEIESEL